jgi:hypothetical protein
VEAALCGVSVGAWGGITIEDCKLRGRAVAGASVRRNGTINVVRSHIIGGRFALYSDEPGGQTVEQCELVTDVVAA